MKVGRDESHPACSETERENVLAEGVLWRLKLWIDL
jgi:hypothetical protein